MIQLASSSVLQSISNAHEAISSFSLLGKYTFKNIGG